MNDTLFELMINGLVLFTSVPVHECAHAWAAEKLGDDTGRREGRVTLNPFAHLTLWGSLALVLIGFGWGKPVNVNPNNFKNPRKGSVITSLAGPASNFIMAFLAMIVFRILSNPLIFPAGSIPEAVAVVFSYIVIINISLGVFNFLPIPPLDGSKIFSAVLPERLYFKLMNYEQYIALALIILLYTNVLDAPLGYLQEQALRIMIFLTNWVDKLTGLIAGI